MRLIRLTLAVWIMRAGNALLPWAIADAERNGPRDARTALVGPVLRLGIASRSAAERLAPSIVETPEQRLDRMGLLPRR